MVTNCFRIHGEVYADIDDITTIICSKQGCGGGVKVALEADEEIGRSQRYLSRSGVNFATQCHA